MQWFVVACLAGCAGGLVAHIQKHGGVTLPVWDRALRLLRLGVVRDAMVGAAAGPIGAYFAVHAVKGVLTADASLVFGLLAGFAGAPILERFAAERLRVPAEVAARAEADEVDRLRVTSRLPANAYSGKIKGESEDGGGAHGWGDR